MGILEIALLIAIILYIVYLGIGVIEECKKAKRKKVNSLMGDMFKMAILSAITEELNKNLKENENKTEKDN